MPQPITPALETLLTSKLLTGARKHRGEIEIDYVVPGFTEVGELQDLNLAYGTVTRDIPRHTGNPEKYWGKTGGLPQYSNDGNASTKASVNSGLFAFSDYLKADLGAAYECTAFKIAAPAGSEHLLHFQYSLDGSTWVDLDYTVTQPSNPRILTFDAPVTARYWAIGAESSSTTGAIELATWEIMGTPTVEHPASLETATYQVASMSLDRSRKMAAAQLDVLLENEARTKGWYTGDGRVFIQHNQIRAFTWYGDPANRVRVFTGLIDRVHEHRNPKRITLKARSRMALLLDPHVFETFAPQGADEEGAVRTEANGVYLDAAIEDIVNDILDRAGWPTVDREIATTGVTLAEYDLEDGTSWAGQITGSDRLATAAQCDVWDDELGVFHFEPSPLLDESEPTADWEFAAGVNVLALDHEADDETRATRVIVSGPMTSTVPKWEEVWSTSKLTYPAGIWHDPDDPDNLRVIDRVTKYIYTIRQSDRAIIAKAYLGGYPLGLSGDPTDPDHYYVLHAPWRNKGLGAGSATGNRLKKYAKATNALVSSNSLPDGRWTALKTDGSNVWLTHYDDGKIYKRTMSGGAVSSHTTTHDGEVQTQPTGLWINGTTMGVFFSGHKRFLLMSTSAPGTVTGSQSTQGTRIAGGEADTVTDIDLYADADKGSFGLTSGYLAKFTLAELVTNDVEATAVDFDLEDALGFQAGLADRDHPDCPNDVDPHPWESRTARYEMKVVQSLAQAQAVADAQLIALSRVRRVLDLATIGHPAIQLNDVIRYLDDIAGIDAKWVIDTYRAAITGRGTYVGSMSVLPWESGS